MNYQGNRIEQDKLLADGYTPKAKDGTQYGDVNGVDIVKVITDYLFKEVMPDD